MRDEAIATTWLSRFRRQIGSWSQRIVQICFLVCLGAFWAHPLQAESVPHFPESVAGFPVLKATDFEATRPGAGTAFLFDDKSGFHATLYVYTAGLTPFPQSLSDSRIQNEHDESARNVLAVARNREPKSVSGQSRLVSATKAGIVSGGQTVPLLRDEFLVYLEGQPTQDWMYLWLAGGKIWKL